MSIFVYLKLPDLQSYNFLPYSDPVTSGGYGPNQVSTIFGLGVAILVLSQILRGDLLGGKVIYLSILVAGWLEPVEQVMVILSFTLELLEQVQPMLARYTAMIEWPEISREMHIICVI